MRRMLVLLFASAAFDAATLDVQADNAEILNSEHNRGHLSRDLRQSTASWAHPCDAATQRLALLTLYNNTNGASWTDATGWPAPSASRSAASLASFAASTPLTTSTCMAAGAVLPDHCCWYGVQCCTPQTCTSSTSSQSCTSCSCTIGLIVGLALGLNNVRQLFNRLKLHPWFP